MEPNKSIIDRITDAFFKRLDEEPDASSIATKVAELITENDKPKTTDFVALYQLQVLKGSAAE